MYDKYREDIKKAKYSVTPWKSHHVKGFKQWIKSKKFEEQKKRCCYCLRSLENESQRAIHIEHILPKSKYPAYMFDSYNLAISCIKCNSDIKSDKDDFLVNNIQDYYKSKWSHIVYSSKLYKFVHPKLDKQCEHLNSEVRTTNNRPYYIYTLHTDKGKYHYDYFKLREFEIDTISECQGIKNLSKDLTSISLVETIYNKHSK